MDVRPVIVGVATTQTRILCESTGFANRKQICRWFVRSEEVVRSERDPRRGSERELRTLLEEAKHSTKGIDWSSWSYAERYDRPGMTGRVFLVVSRSIDFLSTTNHLTLKFTHTARQRVHDAPSMARLWEGPFTINHLHSTRPVDTPTFLDHATTIPIAHLCKLVIRTTRIWN